MDKLTELLSKAKPLSPWFWWNIRNDGAMIISKEEKNNWHSWEICFVKKEELCWKEFWFIKRLIENNKIWRNKNSDRSAMLDLMRVEVKEQTEVFECVEKYEWYIMVLSIQDNPIEFLIDILK